MSDAAPQVRLLTSVQAKQEHARAFEGAMHIRVLAYHAPELLEGEGWERVRARLAQGLHLDLLTLAPGGLAERLQVIAAQRADAPERLRLSRELKVKRLGEAEVHSWKLQMRELDWVPSVSMFLCSPSPDPDATNVTQAFIGIVTPDPRRSSKDKRWMHLIAATEAEREVLRAYTEQFGDLWNRSPSPRPRTVFLSYAHEDAAEADHVEAVLRRRGVEVYRDEALGRPGAVGIEGALKHVLDTCGAFIVLWSRAWEASMWCRAEANHVLAKPVSVRPVIDVLKLGPTASPAPDLRLLDHLYRPAEDRLAREAAVEAIAAASLTWTATALRGEAR